MSTDLELVSRTANEGNKEAFARLVERHQSRIRQFLRRLTAGDWHSADDLAQETFLQAYRKIHQFKASGSFSAWLHSIAWRKFLSWQRKRVTQAEVVLRDDISIDRSNALEAELTAQRLMRLLSRDQRATITLSYAEGLTHEQISEITGFPLGTVKSHLSRGIAKMKTWIERYENKEQRHHQSATVISIEDKQHAG